MIKESNDRFQIVYEFVGEGEHLTRIQNALILAIDCVGSHKEHSGYENHQEAVWILSDLLRECMLDESQTNVGLGKRPYAKAK
jgi:hypothetical protein